MHNILQKFLYIYFTFLVKYFAFQYASSSVALKLLSQCNLFDVIEEAEIDIINNA